MPTRKSKNPHAVALGRLGGKAATKRARQARRENVQYARKFLLSRKVCRACKRNRLAARNRTGLCRECQRAGKKL